MRYIPTLVILVIILPQAACNSESNIKNLVHKNNGFLEFVVDPKYSIIADAENTIKNLEFIPLSGKTESLISGIGKLKKDSTNGFWYILGKKHKNRIYVFKENGRFVKKIENIGNGPGEYQKINSFYVSDGNWIELLDGRNQKLIKYDLQTDTVIAERKVPFYAWEYTYMDNENMVFYKNSQANNLEDKRYFYKILILDKNLDLLRTYFPFELKQGRRNNSVMQPRPLTKADGKINYNEFLSDTIYSVSKNSVKTNFVLNMGRYDTENLDRSKFNSGKEKIEYFFKHRDRYIIGVQHVTEKLHSITFNFIYGDNIYTYLYNKLNNEAVIIKNINVGAGKIELPPPMQIVDNKFVSVYSWQMLSKLPEHKLQKGGKLYSDLLKAKKENKNSVIVLYDIEL